MFPSSLLGCVKDMDRTKDKDKATSSRDIDSGSIGSAAAAVVVVVVAAAVVVVVVDAAAADVVRTVVSEYSYTYIGIVVAAAAFCSYRDTVVWNWVDRAFV